MADFEPPLFSLGSIWKPNRSPRYPPDRPSIQLIEIPLTKANSLDALEQEEVMDSDPEPTRVLKRLRRGAGHGSINSSSSSSVKTRELEGSSGGNGDDDIDEFSSQEDLLIRHEHLPAQCSLVCSSSKIPLRGHGVLTTQSSSQRNARKIAPSTASLETSHNGLMFPKLTISPLRRFQLLDSDSDSAHPLVSEDVNQGTHRIDASSKQSESTATEQKRKVSVVGSQNEDLWKDFRPMKSFPISTPVLDEVCEEYFQSIKDKNAAPVDGRFGNSKGCHTTTSNSENLELAGMQVILFLLLIITFSMMIQGFRSWFAVAWPTFPHLAFWPTDEISSPVHRSQFSNGEASKQKGSRKTNSNKSSTKGTNKSKKSNAEDDSHASEGWVDPRSSSAVPKDAGRRRVHANGQSAGHWYTSPEGRCTSLEVGRSCQVKSHIDNRERRAELGLESRKTKLVARRKRPRVDSTCLPDTPMLLLLCIVIIEDF